MPPRKGRATVEVIAINAVMAGCRPEYMPALIAAVEALIDPSFPLELIQVTTNPMTPLLLFNGPIRHQLDINYGAGCLGPGWRANHGVDVGDVVQAVGVPGPRLVLVPGIADLIRRPRGLRVGRAAVSPSACGSTTGDGALHRANAAEFVLGIRGVLAVDRVLTRAPAAIAASTQPIWTRGI